MSLFHLRKDSDERCMFRVWCVTNILEWRVASSGWIVTQQVLLVADCWRTVAKTAETWRYTQTGATALLQMNQAQEENKISMFTKDRVLMIPRLCVVNGKGVIRVCPLKVSSEFADLRSDWL